MSRIALVTPEVEGFNRDLMSKVWTIIDVEPIYCNHKFHSSITPDQFDLQGENYLAGE